MIISYPDSKCVSANPRSLMNNILDGDPHIGDDPGQLCNATWPVTDNHIEGDQPSISCKTSVKAPPKEGGVYVASTQGQNNSKQTYLSYKEGFSLTTNFFPLSSGSNPAKTAASPVAPAPSTTAFSSSINLRMAMEIQASETVTILSMR